MPLTWTDNMSTDNFNGGALYTQEGASAGVQSPVVAEGEAVATQASGLDWADFRTPVQFPNLYQTVTYKRDVTESQTNTIQWVDVPTAPVNLLSFQLATSFVNTMYLVVFIGGVTITSISKPLTPPALGDYTISASLDYTGHFYCSTSDGQFIETTISRSNMFTLEAGPSLYPQVSQ